jgi:UDP-N-acetylglucosamine:LPS N-acetylglucosamine transferase
LEKDLDVKKFQVLLENLINNKAKLEETAKNMKDCSIVDADKNILGVVNKILKDV